jgi:hypothetical protein
MGLLDAIPDSGERVKKGLKPGEICPLKRRAGSADTVVRSI